MISAFSELLGCLGIEKSVIGDRQGFISCFWNQAHSAKDLKLKIASSSTGPVRVGVAAVLGSLSKVIDDFIESLR